MLRSAPQMAVLRDMFLNTDANGYMRSCQAIADTDLYESTARLRLPTMAIAGGRDRILPPDMMRETAGLIPGCRFEMLPGAGHLPCMDNPEKMAALLTDFLSVNGHG